MVIMKTAMIELDNLDYIRQGHRILSGIHWRIEAGQHWALMGANGSGKTTLLKIITGYDWPTSGQVRVLGRQFGETNIPELRKHIGWVSAAIEQKLLAYDRAIDVVASGIDATLGLYRPFTKQEYGRASKALKTLKAGGLAEQRFQTLSQGEQQKVLIARALVGRPKLLVLDEPCVGLDPGARQRFLVDIGDMARLKTAPAIILVTHHIEEIGDWIHEVMLLKKGKVMARGCPKKVFNSKNLGQLFDFPCKSKYTVGRWTLVMG
jgi:iron complex transport system ATP-binding protein